MLFYTADACFQEQKYISIQIEKLKYNSPFFYALSSCNFLHIENTRKTGWSGPLNFIYIKSSHQWCAPAITCGLVQALLAEKTAQ